MVIQGEGILSSTKKPLGGGLLNRGRTLTPPPKAPDTAKPIDKSNELTKEKVDRARKLFEQIRKEVGMIVIGQQVALNTLIRAILANGHVLIEGVPGIAKTLLIRTLSKVAGCQFSRIQFTPDLLPTDIIGISTYQEGRGFYTLKGPIFSNFVLADEINRAPPKVQSALLEAMAEKQATIAKETFAVPLPFFVLATQNPIENVGTYTLPEAQIDRFLFKLYMGYPSIEEEIKVLNQNIIVNQFDSYKLKPVLNPEIILGMQEDVKKVYFDSKLQKYVALLTDATRNPQKYNVKSGKYLEWGGSPRLSIGLYIASKAEAFMQGKTFVTPHHIKQVAHDVARHRCLLTYEGQAEDISPDDIITEILKRVPVP